MMTPEDIAELRAEYKGWQFLKPYSDFKKCLDEIERLQDFLEAIKSTGDLEDNDRWMREVLTDFRIPFDDHTIGRRVAFTQWMIDHNK